MLFVDHSDVLTSAGAASGVDVCLQLVRQDHGSEVANQVARRCVVPPYRDGGQAQYIERPLPPASATGTGPTRGWALQRLRRARHLLESSDLPVERVAHEVGFATATSLRRHLAAEAGVAPSVYRRTFRASSTAAGDIREASHLGAERSFSPDVSSCSNG